VCAVNDGGRSMPSEILSVCRIPEDPQPVLIVNGFDRIAAPAVVTTPDYSGFQNLTDAGVPDRVDYNFTGLQHDFRPSSPYRSNDGPGYGASFADDETRIVAGNSFDYPFVHGSALVASGRSFVSCSDEAVVDSMVQLSRYRIVDLILGEECATPRVRPLMDSLYGTRFTALPPAMRKELSLFTTQGGRLIVSGSRWAGELWSAPRGDSSGIRFGREVLKTVFVTDHASRGGEVVSADSQFLPSGVSLSFTTELNDSLYAVESPEAISPARGARTLLRYAENSFSAAIGFKGESSAVLLGFPLESLTKRADRNTLMNAIVQFLAP
jgi:hypothetical protein